MSETKINKHKSTAILCGLGAIICILLFTWRFNNFAAFVWGLSTYTWDEYEAIILESEHKKHSSDGRVSVSMTIMLKFDYVKNDTKAIHNTFKQWNGSNDEIMTKANQYINNMKEGSKINILVNDSGQSSIGHWPLEYNLPWGIQTSSYLLLSIYLLWLMTKNWQRYQESSSTPTKAP